MAFNIASVSIRLLANTKQFQRGLADANKRMQTVRRAAGRMGKALAVGVVGGLTAIAVKTATANQRLLNLSKQLNRPIEELQALAFAAQQSGVAINVFETGIRRIERRASDAARGIGEGQAAFAELNIDAAKFLELSLPDQMGVLATQFKLLEGDTKRQSVAFQLMDTDGQALLQTLGEGPAAIARYVEDAKKMDIANREAAEGFDILRRFAGRAIGFIGGKIARTAKILKEFAQHGVLGAPNVAVAQANVARDQAASENAIANAKKVQLDADKRAAILAKTGGKSKSQTRTTATQVRSSLGVLTGGKATEQKVRDPQIKITNALLEKIVSQMAQNSNALAVTFGG